MSLPAAAAHPRMKRDVWLLFFCQGLTQMGMIGQVSMSALIGATLATEKTLSTLPMAVQMLSTMLVAIPSAYIMRYLGRKAGFLIGGAIGFVGACLFVVALQVHSFLLYCIAAMVSGLYFGISQNYRFAAAEVATPDYRPFAISLVMAGGVLSAVLGPELVKWTVDLWMPVQFSGTYLATAVLPLISMVLVSIVNLPPPLPARAGTGRPLGTIMRQPAFIAAAASAMIGWGSMNLIMASTPVEMVLCGYSVNNAATIIQWHALGMYAPSFITGSLIKRFGTLRIIGTGAVLSAACALICTIDRDFSTFWLGLVILGIGWNFMYIGGTALLGTSHTAEERNKTQSANDFLMFGTVTMTAFTSGAVHHALGWVVLNLATLPPLAGAILLLFWLARRQAQGTAVLAR
ncbi:MAG: MFS transporter [Alphaproteobacteria bacterium]|nr:MFS transporter [Alphaproteobacteria bacterium]